MTDIKVEKELTEILGRNNVLIDEPMSKHTSFKVGGKADYFVKVNSVDELKKVFKIAKKYNLIYTIIGNGTNLLVKDGGIRGIVIKLNLNDFKIKRTPNNDDVVITVDSGMTLATLASICLKEEITGAEFLGGIPGTIGGAIIMNAGAFGSEMKDIVVKTKVIDTDGKIKTLSLDDHNFSYRKSSIPEKKYIVLETVLKLKKGTKDQIDALMKGYANFRKEKQPIEYPSAGSTFKRKDEYITAKLIDEAGLKGYSIGDAQVSEKHAGFIINKGKATASEILELIEYIKKRIKEKFNIDIELEIMVIGDDK